MSGISPAAYQGMLQQLSQLNRTMPQAAAPISSPSAAPDQFSRSSYGFPMPQTGAFDSGMMGLAVASLQQRLAALGYLAGTPDGFYSGGTIQAVQYFQQEYGRPVTGRFDQGDYATMMAVLSGQVPRVRNAAGPQAAPVPVQPTPPQTATPAPQQDPAAPTQAPADPATVTVQPGDSLSAIAQRALGATDRWQELYRLNQDQISNPNVIQPGMVLKLPDGASASQPAPASAPTAPTGGDGHVTPNGGVYAPRWNRTWTPTDVEWLARAISAEARGEISKYKSSGDGSYRDSVLGAAYVIARTAADRDQSIQELIKNQPMFLSAWGMGDRSGNSDNYRQFFLPTDQIANWDELVAIAREALMGKDPTGINPNHYYDDSIASHPPDWAQGRGVEKAQIARMVFIDNTNVA